MAKTTELDNQNKKLTKKQTKEKQPTKLSLTVIERLSIFDPISNSAGEEGHCFTGNWPSISCACRGLQLIYAFDSPVYNSAELKLQLDP
ncbi:uncharacterized protein G2W53_002311 [Senna tora]|uniref:Uncharacterized protein n=1 Tax=Senna tora TaxID=362788 RepID=A0A834XKA2_9FABA|nr:uncharacterized protein G2W53_002311 [Senna tora]